MSQLVRLEGKHTTQNAHCALEWRFISHLGIDFSTFRFGVTAVFVTKIWLTRQKVFPLPTVGAPSASNSPSALSARAGYLMIIIMRQNQFLYSLPWNTSHHSTNTVLYCTTFQSRIVWWPDIQKNHWLSVFQVFSMYFDSVTQHCPSLKRIWVSFCD